MDYQIDRAPIDAEIEGRRGDHRTQVATRVITPTELLHFPAYQKRLSRSGSTLQGAIQRAAIAQVQDRNVPVTGRIKQLHALIDDVERNVTATARIGDRLTITPENYADVVREVGASTPPMKHDINCYHLLCRYLEGCKTWEEKLGRLTKLFNEDLEVDQIKYVDVLIAEVLRSKAVLDSLLGGYERLLDRLYEIIDLHGGTFVALPESDVKPIVGELNELLSKAEWPAVKAALISNLYAILSAWTPLASTGFMDELRAIRDVFENLHRVKHVLGGARAIRLVEQRVSRTLSLERLGEQVREAPEKSEQINILIEIGDNVVGALNRTLIGNYIGFIMDDGEFGARLFAEFDNDVDRLGALANLHRALAASLLGEHKRARFQTNLERLQESYIQQADFFGRIDREGGRTLDQAIRLLELCAKHIFTPGHNADMARQIAGHYLLKPDFLPQYLAGAEDSAQRAARIDALRKTLTIAGIDDSVMSGPPRQIS